MRYLKIVMLFYFTFTAFGNDSLAGGWEIEVIGKLANTYTSIALDSQDSPYCIWSDEGWYYGEMEHIWYGSSFGYKYWDGSNWSSTTVDSHLCLGHPPGTVGEYNSIVIDSQDSVHISYYDRETETLEYACHSSDSWFKDIFDSSESRCYSTSIATDSQDRPHISYWTGYYELKYSYWNGSYWEFNKLDYSSSINSSNSTSIALDGQDNPHISYLDAEEEELKYVYWTGSSWEIQIVDSHAHSGNSIVLDTMDHPHISYCSLGYLKYAHWTGPGWEIEIVDPSGDVSCCNSISLDSKGYPHITYYDSKNHNLKYACWTGSKWVTDSVDSNLSTGRCSSIAIDSHDIIHVSYCNAIECQLKYAKKTWCERFDFFRPTTFAIVSLYPNPSSDYLTCLLALPEAGIVELALYDISGRLVLERQFEATEPTEMEAVIDVSGLASGVYTLRANQGGIEVSARAVVVR